MKTIYINGRFLTQKLAGVNRFAYELTKALIASGRLDITIVCPQSEIKSCYDVSGFNIVKYGRGSSHFWEQVVLPFFFLTKKDYLLLNFSGLGPIALKNKISTIHDLAFLYNPSWYSKTYYRFYKIMTPLMVKTAKHLLTVSNCSKHDIMQTYKVSDDFVTVVYNAVDASWKADSKKDKEDFVLCVSSIDPRKNFKMLIKAFNAMPSVRLKIVGSYDPVFCKQDLGEIPSNIEFCGRVDDSVLAELYSSAACFIYPSLYEGFGLPPIEAMHFDCPVLVSDIPVHREVCKDAALYFNPKELTSIVSTVLSYVKERTKLEPNMIAEGRNVERLYSWNNSATTLIDYIISM